MKAESKIKNIDFSRHFAVGLSIGIQREYADEMLTNDYRRFSAENPRLYDCITEKFARSRIGYEVYREPWCIRMIAAFPLCDMEDFVSLHVTPLLDELEAETGLPLICGIGMPAVNQLHLKEASDTSRYAFGLYFFTPQRILEYQRRRRFPDTDLDDFDACEEAAFKALLFKDPDAMDKINAAMDKLSQIHYGNSQAFTMRIMSFTGNLAHRLRRYHLLDLDFFQIQDDLQAKVLSSLTLETTENYVREYFARLIPQVYLSGHMDRKAAIEQVISYMQENFMEEISNNTLANIACVSPSYFSHLFKNETGRNYKEYLTDIRLKHACELLLESDYLLYEISEKVGYKNPRTFAEAFRQKFGCGPNEYRSKLKKES